MITALGQLNLPKAEDSHPKETEERILKGLNSWWSRYSLKLWKFIWLYSYIECRMPPSFDDINKVFWDLTGLGFLDHWITMHIAYTYLICVRYNYMNIMWIVSCTLRDGPVRQHWGNWSPKGELGSLHIIGLLEYKTRSLTQYQDRVLIIQCHAAFLEESFI